MTEPALQTEHAVAATGSVPAQRFGRIPMWVCRTLFGNVRTDADAVARIRGLADRGSLVYIMRYRSIVDYMLVCFILLREGLPLPHFVSDIGTLPVRPLRDIFAGVWRRLRRQRTKGAGPTEDDRGLCSRFVAEKKPVLVFMRSTAPGVRLLTGDRDAFERVRGGKDYLREIVIAQYAAPREVFLLPLAVMRGRGYRRPESRLATFVYSVQEAPGEVRRFLSLVWNARETAIKVGKEVSLRHTLEHYRQEGAERVVRRLSRSLQIFLHREERVVWGPTLRPKRVAREIVLRSTEVKEQVRQLAKEQNVTERRIRRTAERYFHEMAANFHGIYFAVLEFAFTRIWPRVFQGFECNGLDKVVSCMKMHPVVLVPSHRSHFDYLILSYLFHANYLSPPHIAAGINLSFWPLGPLFRGAGAYFIRRTFEGNHLYRAVFRSYLAFLIREGYTQEFFIEGGRSRTGKILTPRLGMLSALVNVFVEGTRRDLYFVPISLHYARIVEEQAYQKELEGAQKERESLWALFKARSILRQKYGTVHVSFGEPISLKDALGENRERFRDADDVSVTKEKARFVHKLGFRILRGVNAATVAGATSVSCTVLLSAPRAAMRYPEFLENARALLAFLRHEGVSLTQSLERNKTDFMESLAFLENAGLLRRMADDVLQIPAEKRLTADFYKNNTIHFFLLPALLTRSLLEGRRGDAVEGDGIWWLHFLRWEFPLPERETIAAELRRLHEYFRSVGAVVDDDVRTDHALVRCLSGIVDNFVEAYNAAAKAILQMGDTPSSAAALTDAMRNQCASALALGEARKPEASSGVTFGNALSLFTEMGFVQPAAESSRKDRLLTRGPHFADLVEVQKRLASRLRESDRRAG
jgi:glycerol-3-phosphate O-acyltransferase